MASIQGEARKQGTPCSATLEELITADPVCQVIDAFVGRRAMEALGFVRAPGSGGPGRPGCATGFAEAVFVRVLASAAFLAAAGSRMLTQHRADMVAGAAGSKFRSVGSSQSVHERRVLEPYLEQMELADGEEEVEADKLWAPLVRGIRRELR